MTTSVYIHIPFCEHLCSYCDFAKQYYYEEIANKYLSALEKEIKNNFRGEKLKTLYIGGGTPSCLSLDNLKKLFNILQIFSFDTDYEWTFEVNPENITEEKLILLKSSGVNRISMGIESTINKNLQYLGRHHDFSLVKEKIDLIKKVGISNINVDLIYAIPCETINDLKSDLDNIMSLKINHISTYSLEIHQNTLLDIKNEKNISEDMDREMFDYICQYLQARGFSHYEVSNFCKKGNYSRHNLVYWHNEKYYGFGLGAAGYVDNIRYNNTRSMHDYLIGKVRLNEEKITKKDQISYELILGFRLINGINKEAFKKKYQEELVSQANIRDLIQEGYLIDDGLNIKISYDKIYVENYILENFV